VNDGGYNESDGKIPLMIPFQLANAERQSRHNIDTHGLLLGGLENVLF
jgi:hypothetical protein